MYVRVLTRNTSRKRSTSFVGNSLEQTLPGALTLDSFSSKDTYIASVTISNVDRTCDVFRVYVRTYTRTHRQVVARSLVIRGLDAQRRVMRAGIGSR